MVIKKLLSKEEKDKIKNLEIDLIKESKEVDRYKHSVGAAGFLGGVGFIINIVLGIISIRLTYSSDIQQIRQSLPFVLMVVSAGLIIYFVVVFFSYIFILRPAEKSHWAKHQVLRQKYADLGVNLDKSDNEVKNMLIKNKKGEYIKFDVDEETKRKRRISLHILIVLLVISIAIIIIRSFFGIFSIEITIGLFSGLVVAFIDRILDWVEASKLKK